MLKKNAYVSKMRMVKAKSSNDTRGVSKLGGEYKRLMKEATVKTKSSKDAEIEASIARKNWQNAAEKSYKAAKENYDIIDVRLKKVLGEKNVKNKESLVAKIRQS